MGKFNQIGNRIRQIREIKGFSQEYMAEKLNMSVSGYGKIERQETEMTLNKLDVISTILDCTVEELLKFDDKFILQQINGSSEHNYGFVDKLTISNNDELKLLYERLLAEKDETIKQLKVIVEFYSTLKT